MTATNPPGPAPIADDVWLTAEARTYDADGATGGRTLMHIEGDRLAVAAALRALADRIDPPRRPAMRPVVRRSGGTVVVGPSGIRSGDVGHELIG